MNKSKIIKALNLVSFGNKGWMRGEEATCIWDCGKSDKFGVLFLERGGVVKCMRCNESTSLVNYLKKIRREDLIEKEDGLVEFKIKLPEINKKQQITTPPPVCTPPLKYKKIYYDDYLEERGFTPEQYGVFNVGVSRDIRLKNYLVFLLKQEGEVVGWLARSKMSKEWHKENMRAFKRKEVSLRLRYRNSDNTDFEKILGGYDEITEKTRTLWLVEGLMDKANTDRLYNLYNQEEIKCCFTFGNNLSDYQQHLIKKKKGIKNIVMLYDFGTTKQIKKHSLQLARTHNVMVGEFKDEGIDAGDATKEYYDKIFNNLVDFYYFYNHKLI